jgi:hypothetical protein
MKRLSIRSGIVALAAAAALAIPAAAMAASIDVDEQATFEAGATTFTVASVTLDEAGYVVIHDGTATTPGAVLGASAYLEAGTYTDLAVSLDREIEDGEYLWPMLHVESGADTTFDVTVDVAEVDAINGNVALDLTVGFPVQLNLQVQTDASFSGSIADVGVSLVVFSGGALADLVAAAEAESVVTIAVTVDGDFLIHVIGAPAFVNAAFNAHFSGDVAAETPMVLVKR